MSEQVSQKQRCPYKVQKDELNLSSWQYREEHWLMAAQHMQKDTGNTHGQSSVTGVLDLLKVNQLCDWARLVNRLFSWSYLGTKTSSKISKEGIKENRNPHPEI